MAHTHFEHLEARDFAEAPEVPGVSAIPTGYVTYANRIGREQTEAHGGERDGAYTDTEEIAFAQAIGQAAAAEASIAALAKDEQAAAREQHAETLLAGRQARDALVLGSLRFAAYYARTSMNILPEKNGRRPRKKAAVQQPADTALEPENIDSIGIDDSPGIGSRRVGAYADITRLRSRWAELDDRIQVATEALIDAAATYRHKLDSNKKRIPFISHAGYKIHAALGNYAKTTEPPGWSMSTYTFQTAHNALKDSADYDEYEMDTFRRRLAGRDTVSLDEVATTVAVPQDEYESDWYPVPQLELADVYADRWPETKMHALGELALVQKVELCLGKLAKKNERGAGVLRLLYGINEDGKKYTLKDVGEVYSISIGRVQQLKKQTLAALHNDPLLKGIVDEMGHPTEVPLLRHDIAVTPYDPAMPTIRAVANAEGASLKGAPTIDTTSADRVAELEKDQLHSKPAHDDWDSPSRLTPHELTETYERVRADLKRLMYRSGDYHFQRSFAEAMHSEYPRGLASIINEQIGKELTVGHLEEFWNTGMATHARVMRQRLGEDFDVNRLSTVLNYLLAERMRDQDRVELTIPEELDGKLEYMGAWLQNGTIAIRGNVGDLAGYKMKGLARVEVHGNVGDFAATAASGHAMMHVTGDAGHFFGGQASKYVHLRVDGNVGDNCAYEFTGPDSLMVIAGTAGKNPGEKSRGSVVTIGGQELPSAVA